MEVQAGLARNQAEYVDMPADTQWCWLEAYGMMQADPKLAHDSDYEVAYREVQARLDAALSYCWMETELVGTEAMANKPPAQVIQRGSPWGAVERRRRELAGLRPFCPPALVFDDQAITDEAAAWVALAEKGELPYRAPADGPGAFMTHPEWMAMLETALKNGRAQHWLSWLHLGVMHYHHHEMAQARTCWEKSLSLEPSAWAYRNLAVVARDQRHKAEGADLYLKAVAIEPGLWQLAAEACNALIDADRPQEALDLVGRLPEAVARRARVRVLAAKAMLDLGDVDSVRTMLTEIELTDVREGELSLTELWYYMHEKRISKAEGIPIDQALRERVWREFPPPAQIDFRLWTGPPVKGDETRKVHKSASRA
jgi:tetratricopeptide (TPR) repeat protein